MLFSFTFKRLASSPVSDLFAWWCQWPNFPSFLPHDRCTWPLLQQF